MVKIKHGKLEKTGQWRWWFPISHSCFPVTCVFLTPDVYGFDGFSYRYQKKTGGFTLSWFWVIPTLLWGDTTTMSEHLGVGRRDEGKRIYITQDAPRCAGVDQLHISGRGIPPLIRNPYSGWINPCEIGLMTIPQYNGSLDPSTDGYGNFTTRSLVN